MHTHIILALVVVPSRASALSLMYMTDVSFKKEIVIIPVSDDHFFVCLAPRFCAWPLTCGSVSKELPGSSFGSQPSCNTHGVKKKTFDLLVYPILDVNIRAVAPSLRMNIYFPFCVALCV